MSAALVPTTHEQVTEFLRGRFRAGIVELEAIVTEGAPDPHGAADYPLLEHRAPGLYAREISIKAHEFIIGRIHRHAHINVISKGRVIVWTEDGERELVAPATFVSSPGTKRALYTLEDTVWTTIHATDETETAKIEAELIAPSYAALEEK